MLLVIILTCTEDGDTRFCKSTVIATKCYKQKQLMWTFMSKWVATVDMVYYNSAYLLLHVLIYMYVVLGNPKK